MKCPHCTNIDLIKSKRQGNEIDYCPTCRGMWLDRGDLDTIMERSAQDLPAPAARMESLNRHQVDDSHYGFRYKKYSG